MNLINAIETKELTYEELKDLEVKREKPVFDHINGTYIVRAIRMYIDGETMAIERIADINALPTEDEAYGSIAQLYRCCIPDNTAYKTAYIVEYRNFGVNDEELL